MRKIVASLGALALLVGFAVTANANSILVSLLSTAPNGANTNYTYDVTLTAVNQVDPGVRPDGIHDGFTLYDFNGLVGGPFAETGLLQQVLLPDFVPSVTATTAPPSGTAPADSSAISNVNFTYTGPGAVAPLVAAVPTDLGTFTVTSIYSAHAVQHNNYTGADHSSPGDSPQGNIGNADTPIVPVPASVWGGLGLLGLLAGKRIVRRQTA